MLDQVFVLAPADFSIHSKRHLGSYREAKLTKRFLNQKIWLSSASRNEVAAVSRLV